MKIKSEQILSSDLAQYKYKEVFTALDRLLSSGITHFERELLEKKSKKLSRDRKDYLNDNIRFWQNKANENN